MKKSFFFIVILFCTLLFSQVTFAQTSDPGVVVDPKQTTVGPCIGADCTYELLEPLPGLEKVDQSMDVGKWVNTMVRVIIGIIGVLAVVMIVVGGIQYMTTDAIGKKESGKETVQGALFGVVLALAAYIILRTINPQLVSLDLAPGTAKTGGVSVNIPTDLVLKENSSETGDGSIDKSGNYTFDATTTITPALAAGIEKLKNGWEIDYFKLYTNKRLLIALKNGSEKDTSVVINADIGRNGFADIGTSKSQDKKTPKGTWKIISTRQAPTKNTSIYNDNGVSLGPAIYHLNIYDGNTFRGIGLHGSKHGTVGSSTTAGCIQIKNSDLLAIIPYIKIGNPFYIGD